MILYTSYTHTAPHISGNLWSRTVRGARAERIEYLLLHEFHALKYILPEKKGFDQPATGALVKKGGKSHMNLNMDQPDDYDDDDRAPVRGVGGTSRTRAKASYAGGLVLEPKKALYDTYILLLDFNSLYPSLIQEYNLCFTTIEWTKFMNDTPSTTSTTTSTTTAKGGKGSTHNSNNKRVLDVIDEGEDGGVDGDNEGVNEEEDGEMAAKKLPPLPDTGLDTGMYMPSLDSMHT